VGNCLKYIYEFFLDCRVVLAVIVVVVVVVVVGAAVVVVGAGVGVKVCCEGCVSGSSSELEEEKPDV